MISVTATKIVLKRFSSVTMPQMSKIDTVETNKGYQKYSYFRQIEDIFRTCQFTVYTEGIWAFGDFKSGKRCCAR